MELLYEDGDILVCVKPVGAPSEPNGSGRDVITLASEQTGCECRAVHRLDAATGGAIIVAKTKKGAAAMSVLVRDGLITKEYLAVVGGTPEAEGEMHDLLFRDRAKNKSYVVKRERKGVRDAHLTYRTVETVGCLSLVLVRLQTGRTHQIRVQFASRGIPLLGDRRYGGNADSCGLALWSRRIGFTHPITGAKICAESSPPDVYPWSIFDISPEKC
ncbi:MAG: RluA family pseudouridine synthase [Oscillospiraceae bacterium]|nr:RluA family pseudouridine synthase [Oscillospiraceae bacterium]